MTLLNEADKIYIGSLAADRVYAGANLVWQAGAPASSPPAYRSHAGLTYAGGRTNSVIPAPAGIQNNDQLIAAFFTGTPTSPITTTPPAGFVHVSGSPISVADFGGFNGRFNVFRKPASGESGSYTFTHTSASTEGVIMAISGVNPTTPIDVYSTNTGEGTTTTILGVTTTVANTLLLNINFNWNGGGATSPPTNGAEQFTEIWDGIITAAWKTNAAVGATGNFTQTNGNTAITEDWGALLAALRPA
jgi:hypothetical protein